MTRFQPSTRMNSRILNGSEMKTGGSIIMPIDINVEETTRSMIRNGRKIRKPIWKAVLSSEMMNAGIRTCGRDVLAGLDVLDACRELDEQREVLRRASDRT